MTDPREDTEHSDAEQDERSETEQTKRPETEPAAEDLDEPSTEKDPGEQPRTPEHDEPEPDHQAVGIGVIGRPQTKE
ncbi:hypothetical protein L2X99_06030 [Microbacterium sp. KUDC0406]|uniref:hypothetical protein n=1 Tax=Microbacterium sp. KUDC0406 TaxID=2909588 RepID=UPI001F33498E|nr:hypothetical protein [Microbacterium sp. KUDC0406]UJP11128.1 hypothetical protein L2X99_06030 [Microbacterium sp. KUDC0406]